MNSLPKLIGSDKQIAWAEEIRAEKIPEIERLSHDLFMQMPAGQGVICDKVLAELDKIKNEARASVWIAQREEKMTIHFVQALIKQATIHFAQALIQQARESEQ